MNESWFLCRGSLDTFNERIAEKKFLIGLLPQNQLTKTITNGIFLCVDNGLTVATLTFLVPGVHVASGLAWVGR